jgi:hypothetical protein
MHLNETELIDLAEGTRPEASAPHLAGCARCRTLIEEMRATIAAAAAADLPEPSPLFWDHLSDRVRQAVAAEPAAPRRAWHDLTTWWRVLAPASAAALVALMIAGALTWRAMPQTHVAGGAENDSASARAADATPADPFSETGSEDDSLMLVADLSAAMNVDPASDANLAPNGSIEHAVMDLNDDELRELERLLKQELAPSGA